MTTSSPGTSGEGFKDKRIESSQQPYWHVIVLCVLSLLLYLPYWYYKTVRDLRRKADEVSHDATEGKNLPLPLLSYKGKNAAASTLLFLSPTLLGLMLGFVVAFVPAPQQHWLRMVGPLIPLITLLFFTLLFRNIAMLYGEGIGSACVSDSDLIRSFTGEHPLLLAISLTVSMVAFWILSKCGGPFFLLFTLCCLPVSLAQHWLNQFFKETESPDALVRYAFNPIELLLIIVGSLFLALIVLSFSIKT